VNIRGGFVTVTIGGDRFAFTNPEVFAELGSGYRVIVCFDPTDPQQGAAILSAAPTSNSHQSLKVGQYLCQAGYSEASAMFLGPEASCDGNIELRKRYNRAFRAYFTTPGILGRKGVRADEARDGRGNVQRIEQGGRVVELGSREPSPDDESARLKAHAHALRRGERVAAPEFDEEAELARVARSEREAIERGDLLASN
jgi:hypothetical protein